ncbi:MAG: YjdF family protein [Pleomorphochaeta sp.]
MCSVGSFSVFFEEPFWVGVFESQIDGVIKIAKVTFYKEPTEKELQIFLLEEYDKLIFFEKMDNVKEEKNLNSKRKIRDAKKQMRKTYSNSKSKDYIKQQFELLKKEKKVKKSIEKKNINDEKFIQRKAKRKEKHRGH